MRAPAARNAGQKKSINLLKLGLADCKYNTAKKSEATERMENKNFPLISEFHQQKRYSHYLSNDCRRKNSVIDRQNNSMKNEKPKQSRLRIAVSRFKIKL